MAQGAGFPGEGDESGAGRGQGQRTCGGLAAEVGPGSRKFVQGHPGGRWRRRARGRDGSVREEISRWRGKTQLFRRSCRSTRQEAILQDRKEVSGRHGGHAYVKTYTQLYLSSPHG